MRIGPVKLRLPGRASESDPYWDRFINRAPDDPNNLLAAAIPRLAEGTVYAIKTEMHSPEVTSRHIKELATFLGADACGIARLVESDGGGEYPFAIVCLIESEYDPRAARGIGGQAAVLRGGYVTFNLGAWIRECGYRATRLSGLSGEALATRAGLGTLDSAGQRHRPGHRTAVHVAQVVLTDLPLAPDGEGLD